MKLPKSLVVVTALFFTSSGGCYTIEPGVSLLAGANFGYIDEYGPVRGLGISLLYEGHSGMGLMASFTGMDDFHSSYDFCAPPFSDQRKWYCDDNNRYNRWRNHCYYPTNDSPQTSFATYRALMAGPTFKLTESLSVFGLGGVSWSEVSKGLTEEESSISLGLKDDHSKKFAYAIGMNYGLTENVLISLGYEGSKTFFDGMDYDIGSLFMRGGFHF